ncbi:hypothetical protein ACFQZ4_53445 [Catellatospora coxensis]
MITAPENSPQTLAGHLLADMIGLDELPADAERLGLLERAAKPGFGAGWMPPPAPAAAPALSACAVKSSPCPRRPAR